MKLSKRRCQDLERGICGGSELGFTKWSRKTERRTAGEFEYFEHQILVLSCRDNEWEVLSSIFEEALITRSTLKGI
jgi:hypothetical protein